MIKFFETDETPTSDVITVGDKFTVDDYKKYNSLHPEVPIDEAEHVYLSFDFAAQNIFILKFKGNNLPKHLPYFLYDVLVE